MPAGLPRFVFVPVSALEGSGEYYRLLAIARGMERRWPGCRIAFVLNRAAHYAASSPYPVLPVNDSPTRDTAGVVAHLASERPDVAIFDSAGRVEQYRAARRLGAHVVYVSSRPRARWKGFRLRRMRVLSQHWITQPAFAGGALTRWERLKLRLAGGPELVWLDPLHDEPDAAATRALQSRLGLAPGGYVFACPGGGGYAETGRNAATVLLDAAHRWSRDPGIPTVAILGPRIAERHRGVATADGSAPVHVLASLPNAQLVGLLRDARVAVVNGASLMLQAMVQRVPTVAVPAGVDQPARIAACVQGGWVRSAPLEEDAIVAATVGLYRDAAALAQLRASLDTLGLGNGVATAVAAVERLLDRKARR
jgi:hypothetical protein